MIETNDSQHFGLSYNTDRPQLKIPEYGRTLQQMVDHCVSIPEKEKRNMEARLIINVMGEINPHLRNVPDFQHKLWDQIFIMSDFKIDIDSPFPTPTRETLSAPPERLQYPSVLNKYRYYGHYIRSMIDIACSWEEGEKRDALIIAIAKHMKKAYLEWNKDLIEDEVIGQHLEELSNGKINFSYIKSLLPKGELGMPNAQGIPVKKRFIPQNGAKKITPLKNKKRQRK